MNLTETKSKQNTKNWMVAFIVFALAVLAPEYVAPFFTAIGVIYTIKKKQVAKKTFSEFSIGYMLIIFICWMAVGVLYANSIVSALAAVGLWILMFSGMWLCSVWINTPDKMVKIIYGGAFAGGINGLLGVFQALARNFWPEFAKVTNPFWRFIDIGVQEIFKLATQNISYEFPRKEFIIVESRSCGTLSNPLFFATFEVAMIPFAMYCFLNGKKRSHRIFGLASLLLSLGGIAFSYSRGPYLVAVVVFFMLMIYGGKKALKILGTGLGCAGLVMLVLKDIVINRLLTLFTTTDVSINTRKLIWDAVFEKIPERFWFGYGTGFDSVRSILHNEYSIQQPHAHNILLEIHMENGIIGVVLFLAMCLVFVYNILKIYKKGGIAKYFAITLFVSYMGLCLCGMTDCIFYGLKPLQYLMMILGLTQACANMKIEKTNEEKEQAE